MRRPILHLLILVMVPALELPRGANANPAVPGEFVVENAYPGLVFDTPTAFAFTPDGRLLVAEKMGTVRIVEGGALRPQPVWNGAREVLSNGDRGLVGIAVDPEYVRNHRVYLFYTVDPDSDGVDDEVPAFTRLVRYETAANDSNVVDPATRTVLIGSTWRTGIPSPTLSHAVDCLRWGEDGSLLVSHGDGAHYEVPDAGGLDPMQFSVGRSDPAEDIGCFRAQDMGSLAGKILRINPENGFGYASNPFADGNLASNRSRVWAYGFRNPFRFCVRPGTGSPDTSAGAPGVLYVGDVGAGSWEELDIVVTPGSNFGWPCFEGPQPNLSIENVSPSHHGCSSVGTPQNPSVPLSPPLRWEHVDSTQSLPVGLVGNCTAGALFYSGAQYPEHYRGRLFFGDFGAGWLRVARFDDAQAILSVQNFGTGLDGPVDWAIDPVSEELLYVSINTGEVRRFRYVGGTGVLPIVAQANAYPPIGSAPASVALSSLGSYSPAGEDVRFTWSFGDGTTGSTEPHPVHVYGAGEFTAILTVSGDGGRIARDTVKIVIAAQGGFPVAGVLDAFARADAPLAAPWTGSISGLAVRDSALVQTSASSYATWNGGVLEANQEVFVRFDSITPTAPEHDLLLKTQSTSWSAGAIQVLYDVPGSVVVVNTYAPGQGWVRRSGTWRGVRFDAGDVFGARAYSNGIVNVYRNGQVIGTTSVVGWPFAASGGRVGIMLKGASATRLAAFGGGSVGIRTNLPPVATIVSPLDGTFYAHGEQIVLRGAGTDSDDPDSSLSFRWRVTLRHNNHLHPDIHTSAAAVDSFEADDHDDGTGVSLIIRLVVSDARGASDTATVEIHPEVDLVPARLTALPAHATGAGFTDFAFSIENRGRMPAPRSHWALRLDGMVIAEGDTVVPALDTVAVVRSLASPGLSTHLLRIDVDALGAVPEIDEDNTLERTIPYPAFPSSRLRDAFAREDGPLGTSWTGNTTGLRIGSGALVQTTTNANAIWAGDIFGLDQEAFCRFDSVNAIATEIDLLVKIQGLSRAAGAIQVVYAAHQSLVVVNTYSPASGWVRRGGPWRGIRFVAGDQMGARASSNGAVTVYRNGAAIGSTSVGNWEFSRAGGRIGLSLTGASGTRIVDFGGGDLTQPVADAPRARIDLPIAGMLVAPGDRLRLSGSALLDSGHTSPSAQFRWKIGVSGREVTRFAATDTFTLPQDAAGSIPITLVVTGPEGETDTTHTSIECGAGVLDEFERATGPPGPSWFGVTTAFAVQNGSLRLGGASGYLTWAGGAFGSDQEAWMELDSLGTGGVEWDLLLKVQGPSWSAGAVQVVYAPAQSVVVVNSYAPGTGWRPCGGPWRGIVLGAGDRFGARATMDGRVIVYRNGIVLGTASLGAWPYSASGGRVGLIMAGSGAWGATRFGGGTRSVPTAASSGDAVGAVTGFPALPPASLRLSNAIPNPTAGDAWFVMELPWPSRVRWAVFDVNGREVWSAPSRVLDAGPSRLLWPRVDKRGIRVPIGLYIIRITIGDSVHVRRVTVLR